jgi:iron(III) transport system permease protein
MLLWSSLLPGYEPPSVKALHDLTWKNFTAIASSPSLTSSVKNSVITAVVAAAVVTILSAVIAYMTVKTRTKGRGVLDFLAMVPMAVPGIIVGVGILFWYLVIPLPLHLYGTLTILIIAFVTIGLPYGIRYMVSGIDQIHDELEGAAAVSGASWIQTFRRIYLPLLRPSLLATFLYVMMLAFREVSGVILLYTGNTQILSVTIYNLWSTGKNSYPQVAALGVAMAGVLGVLLLLVRLLGARTGIMVIPSATKGGKNL